MPAQRNWMALPAGGGALPTRQAPATAVSRQFFWLVTAQEQVSGSPLQAAAMPRSWRVASAAVAHA